MNFKIKLTFLGLMTQSLVYNSRNSSKTQIEILLLIKELTYQVSYSLDYLEIILFSFKDKPKLKLIRNIVLTLLNIKLK